MRRKGLLLVLLLNSHISTGTTKQLSIADKDEFHKSGRWLDSQAAWAAYEDQFQNAEMLGRGNSLNPNRLIFYPEDRLLRDDPKGRRIVLTVFCLLSPDIVRGYRTNSVMLFLLQQGFYHRRGVLAPKRKLANQADQLNCWNYEQSSSCWPKRECKENEACTVGLVTKEGWGIFQLYSSRETQSHYQCITETQSILSINERISSGLAEHTVMASNVKSLQVFDKEIGWPQLILKSSYERGQKLSAGCTVQNSDTGSQFSIDLVLKRPPPDGVPGPYQDEYLKRLRIGPLVAKGSVNWDGESALLSHHGLIIECRISDDWGELKGKRVARGQLMIRHMFPAYLDNPRIRVTMTKDRGSFKDHYKSPNRIELRMAEYAVCKADGYPAPSVMWSVNEAGSVWILDDTLFITSSAPVGRPFIAICLATSADKMITDYIRVEIVVKSHANCILPSLPFGFFTGLMQAFLLWFVLYPCAI